MDFTSLHLIAIIIRAPKNNANITTQDFTNSESDCGGCFFFSRFFLFSHGFSPSVLRGPPYLRMTNRSWPAANPPFLSKGLQVAASWSTTAIECTGDFFSMGPIFFWGFGRWVFLLDIGIEWNLFQRHFCWKIQEWHPSFLLNIEKWACWEVLFLGQGHHDAVFNEVRTSSLLLPIFPLMWITKRTRSTYVEKDFPFWKPCLKLPLIWKFHRTFH